MLGRGERGEREGEREERRSEEANSSIKGLKDTRLGYAFALALSRKKNLSLSHNWAEEMRDAPRDIFLTTISNGASRERERRETEAAMDAAE